MVSPPCYRNSTEKQACKNVINNNNNDDDNDNDNDDDDDKVQRMWA